MNTLYQPPIWGDIFQKSFLSSFLRHNSYPSSKFHRIRSAVSSRRRWFKTSSFKCIDLSNYRLDYMNIQISISNVPRVQLYYNEYWRSRQWQFLEPGSGCYGSSGHDSCVMSDGWVAECLISCGRTVFRCYIILYSLYNIL